MRSPSINDPRGPGTRPFPWRVLGVVVLLKVYTLLLFWGFARQVHVPEEYKAFLFLKDGQNRAQRIEAIEGSFLERLAPYDGQYYLDIAANGYRIFGTEDPNLGTGPGGNHAFFPLYPFIMRAFSPFRTEAGLAALLALNLVLSCAGVMGVYLIALRLGISAWMSVLLIVTFPTAVFQSALYTESLFLCLSVGSAMLAVRTDTAPGGRPPAFWECWAGAVLGYLSGLARPQGVLVSLLWLGPALRAWKRRDPQLTKRSPVKLISTLAPVLAPFLGLATYSMLLWASIGAPLGFLGVQRHWSRDFSPGHLLGEVFRPWTYEGPPFDYVAFWLGVGLLPTLWRRLPRDLALFGTASVLFPLSTGTIPRTGLLLPWDRAMSCAVVLFTRSITPFL